MATPTAVCPECGSATAPGRYTCAACGAFLDGVSVTPRAWEAQPDAAPPAESSPAAPLEPAALAETSAPGAPVEPFEPLDDDLPLETSGDVLLDDGPTFEPVAPSWPPRQPDVLHDVQWPDPASREPVAAAAASPAPAAALAPAARVPAGSWLPPSALLTGLDEANANGAAAAVLPGGGAGPRVARPPRDWLAAVGTPERRLAVGRRGIGIGAAVILIGFVLPWAGGSVQNLLAVWTSVWGFSGAGHWLVALAIAALGILASTSGRLATLALGVPAIAAASLVLGLVWSSLLGSTRPIGVLVVFVGVVVLAVGGVLELGARHEAATPGV